MNPNAQCFIPKKHQIPRATQLNIDDSFTLDAMMPSFVPSYKKSSCPLDDRFYSDLNLAPIDDIHEKEMRIVDDIKKIIREYQSKKGLRCVVPSEYVQNILKQRNPDDYNDVIDYNYSSKWHKFVNNYLSEFEIIKNNITDGMELSYIILRGDDVTESLRRECERNQILLDALMYSMYNAVWLNVETNQYTGANGDIPLNKFLEWYENSNNLQDFCDNFVLYDIKKMPNCPKPREIVKIMRNYPERVSILNENNMIRFLDALTWKPQKGILNETKKQSYLGACFEILTRPVIDPERDEHMNKLVAIIRQYILDNNPNKGSIPSERIQNNVKEKHEELYKMVVGKHFMNQWHKFISYNVDVFHLFFMVNDKRSVWRIRLIEHVNWKEADRLEQEEMNARELNFKTICYNYLRWNGKQKIDTLIDHINSLGIKCPARGDFCRFLRRNNDVFMVTGKHTNIVLAFTVSLKPGC